MGFDPVCGKRGDRKAGRKGGCERERSEHLFVLDL
jgi:hypothetical protein